ncbi:sigma 54-interacting transcriptional regulator [bacterium]|nr:sigma 54-interacting transcriptional regulator [bacterium]
MNVESISPNTFCGKGKPWSYQGGERKFAHDMGRMYEAISLGIANTTGGLARHLRLSEERTRRIAHVSESEGRIRNIGHLRRAIWQIVDVLADIPCGERDVQEIVQEALAQMEKPPAAPVQAAVKIKKEEYLVIGGAMKEVLERARLIAPSRSPVLLLGETGVGKEWLARDIHNHSPRHNKPYEVVDCTRLRSDTAESEVFGHEPGSFTGAKGRRIGRFEEANGGTVFLDEVGELPEWMQLELLRVLQDGKFRRMGGTELIETDVRIVAATSKKLKKLVDETKFSDALYYRIRGCPIKVPPLRERREEIPHLTRYFLSKEINGSEREVTITDGGIEYLQTHRFGGNVRELEECIKSAFNLAKNGIITKELLESHLEDDY